MPIAEIPKQISSRIHPQDRRWTRVLAAASLFSGAVLLISGRRKAGLAVATAGTVIAMLEEPESLTTAWATVPAYIETGKRFLGRLEGVVDEISAQGQRVRGLIDRVPRY
jgi:hypothetical protein